EDVAVLQELEGQSEPCRPRPARGNQLAIVQPGTPPHCNSPSPERSASGSAHPRRADRTPGDVGPVRPLPGGKGSPAAAWFSGGGGRGLVWPSRQLEGSGPQQAVGGARRFLECGASSPLVAFRRQQRR